MADGNFNRSHLNADPFLSGIQIGKARQKKEALEAFDRFIAGLSLAPSEAAAYKQLFLAELNKF